MSDLPPLNTSIASHKDFEEQSASSRDQQPTASRASSPLSVHEEDNSRIPQSFESTSHDPQQPQLRYIPGTEAFSNSGNMGTAIYNPAALAPPPTRFYCACSTFRGWKNIPIAGKRASKSFSDLRVLTDQNDDGWLWEIPHPTDKAPRNGEKVVAAHDHSCATSHQNGSPHLFVPVQNQEQADKRAPIEKLSVELL
ncbi:hypothetical protein KEM54_003345, partial [Ascosphaera aggregata]